MTRQVVVQFPNGMIEMARSAIPGPLPYVGPWNVGTLAEAEKPDIVTLTFDEYVKVRALLLALPPDVRYDLTGHANPPWQAVPEEFVDKVLADRPRLEATT